MEELTYVNGEILPASMAVIPVTDRAVLYGDSVFETIRAYGGRPFRLDRHLARLYEGCRLMRIRVPFEARYISLALAELLEASGLDTGRDAYVRITITGGQTDGPGGLVRPCEPGLFIIAHPYVPPSEDDYQRGITLAISGIKRNVSSPLSGMKSGCCMDAVFAKQEAKDRGFDDAVMLTTAGNIAEGTTWNIFVVKDGELLTPNMGCGFLPGITRETIIELGLQEGIRVREITEGYETLLAAEEAFASGSTVEIMPVRRIGSHLMTFCPGPVTQGIRDAYRALVERETAAD